LPPSQQRLLMSGQANWLRETRNPCGKDVACLRDAYDRRTSTLQDIARSGHF
jgi:uncharacterized protein